MRKILRNMYLKMTPKKERRKTQVVDRGPGIKPLILWGSWHEWRENVGVEGFQKWLKRKAKA